MLLRPPPNAQRHTLADVMDEVRYSDGEYLVTMGEVADALFFIALLHQVGRGTLLDLIAC